MSKNNYTIKTSFLGNYIITEIPKVKGNKKMIEHDFEKVALSHMKRMIDLTFYSGLEVLMQKKKNNEF